MYIKIGSRVAFKNDSDGYTCGTVISIYLYGYSADVYFLIMEENTNTSVIHMSNVKTITTLCA
jgi:hypothetical protein